MTNALMPVFNRAPLMFERGEGAWLTTVEGERYLDFGSGIAVNALGYSHPHLIEALERQGRKFWHLSNVYRIPEIERLAERLTAACFADVAFFANSGAEANECAIKVARRYHDARGHSERWRIVTFEGAFHGRTLATMAAAATGSISMALGLPLKASISVHSEAWTQCDRLSGQKPLPSWSNRSRAKAASELSTPTSCESCAICATSVISS